MAKFYPEARSETTADQKMTCSSLYYFAIGFPNRCDQGEKRFKANANLTKNQKPSFSHQDSMANIPSRYRHRLSPSALPLLIRSRFFRVLPRRQHVNIFTSKENSNRSVGCFLKILP
jgi:hypothetical protein